MWKLVIAIMGVRVISMDFPQMAFAAPWFCFTSALEVMEM
jgi:hypothetical protein